MPELLEELSQFHRDLNVSQLFRLSQLLTGITTIMKKVLHPFSFLFLSAENRPHA